MKRFITKHKLADKARALIATAAPTVATALGGPLAGVATRAVAQAMMGREDASTADVEAAIAAASGDDLIKLKELETTFKAQLIEAGVELEHIAASDRYSARNRQVAMKDWTPTVLGVLIIIGYFAVLGSLFFFGMPTIGSQVLLLCSGLID